MLREFSRYKKESNALASAASKKIEDMSAPVVATSNTTMDNDHRSPITISEQLPNRSESGAMHVRGKGAGCERLRGASGARGRRQIGILP